MNSLWLRDSIRLRHWLAVFFVVGMNMLLNKQSSFRLFKTTYCLCDVTVMLCWWTHRNGRFFRMTALGRHWRLWRQAATSLQWRHNERYGVSNHQHHDCLLNRLFKAQIKENMKASRHWPLCGEFNGDRWIPPHKRPVTRKMFPFDDVIIFPVLTMAVLRPFRFCDIAWCCSLANFSTKQRHYPYICFVD